MIVIIPAAGEGKRLADIQPGVPKALKKVDGIPMICHTLAKIYRELTGDLEPEDVFLVVNSNDALTFRGALHKCVIYWGLKFVEQPGVYGTGNAVWRALEFIAYRYDEGVLVMYPDVLADMAIAEFVSEGNAVMTKPREGSGSCVYRCPSDPNRVVSVSEKPTNSMGNVDEKLGDWYYVENAMHLYIALKCLGGLTWEGYQDVYKPQSSGKEFSLTQGIDALMRCGLYFRGVRVDDYCSLGNPEGFNKAEEWLKRVQK